jgi:hypothetical protein
MAWDPADKLRGLLGDTKPAGGSDADLFFTDDDVNNLIQESGGNMNRAAYEGWRLKAANYAELITITEGNAMRQMSDLHKHALDMIKHFETASSTLVMGRTRVGRIRRRY